MEGVFTGGAYCGEPYIGCRSCDVQTSGNCQRPNYWLTTWLMLSDLRVLPTGAVVADDFVPTGISVSQVCVWGAYFDATMPWTKLQCTPSVPVDEEKFRVRVYADDNGLPGTLVGEAVASGSNVVRVLEPYLYGPWSKWGIYGYTLTLDAPIDGMSPGQTHWLEVASARDLSSFLDTCYWHWLQTSFDPDEKGNSYSAVGTNDRPNSAGIPGSGYIPGSELSTDVAFCLGGASGPLDFEAPQAPTGACCDCDGGCLDDQTLQSCGLDPPGRWTRACSCENSGICAAGPDKCADGEDGMASNGPDCEPAIIDPMAPGDRLVSVDTTCSTTDGPEFPFPSSKDAMGKDNWYRYTATCTGTVVASMCMSGNTYGGYDSIVAIYHDYDNPYECPCPGSSTAFQVGVSDEGCSGTNHSAGILEADTMPGECWLIRVGGWGNGSESLADSGRGMLDIACMMIDRCIRADAPQADTLPLDGDPANRTNRYLSIRIPDANFERVQAIRVTFADMPTEYQSWEGLQMWVGEPKVYCENAGHADPPGGGCGPAPGLDREFLAATLQCSPLYRDWNADGVMHVFHEGLIPGGIYDVQTIEEGCSTTAESSYSPALELRMSGWGDVVSDCTTTPCGPPNGRVDVTTDVTAVLDKFKNSLNALVTARADIEPQVPDQKINISDVTFALDAFRGRSYPPGSFPAAGSPPCQ
jgi:hypothetical protein